LRLMHIYIDESGVFSNPSNKPNVASVVVALTVPSSNRVKLFNEFRELALELPTEDGEVKGRLLDESHVASVSALLGRYDCIVETNAIDIALHTEDQLKEYQTAICDAIAGWATAERPEEFKKQVAEVAAALKKPKSPLFVESFLLMVLVPRILEVSMNYYARRIPKELQSYHWVVDGKDTDVTAFEKAWYTVIFPSIEHQSKQKPFEKFLNGDYSYLEPFYTLPTRKAARAKAELGDDLDKAPFDIEPILQDFKFQNSKDNLGLQMADVVANATQRALNGRLKEDGYLGIGKLMVINNEPALRFCLLDPKAQEYGPVKVPSPFYAIIDKILAQRKPMQASPEQEAYLERRAKRRRKKQLGYCKAFSEIFRP
jgi:hypothetical protein